MISVEEAKRMLLQHVRVLPAEPYDLWSRGSHYVVEDVLAPFDHPLFDTSAVDGYALAPGGASSEWKVVGEVAAGEVLPVALRSGECARIFTGAMVPAGAESVVMQEFVTRNGDLIAHIDQRLRPGANIRRKAEHVQRGSVVFRAGDLVNAATKGLLASIGVTSVDTVAAPEVSVIITGGEFTTKPALRPGAIFSSNDAMLDMLVQQAGAISKFLQVADDAQALEEVIQLSILNSDMVITTGGASVGDHDLIRPVLEAMGAEIFFHGVAQKPGKPMLFATLHGVPVFALPGNPRAVMICFWEYVLPYLRAMQGAKDPWLRADILPLSHALAAKGDRAEFRAAQVKGGKVTLLADEGSHMLRSLIDAEALAYLPSTQRAWGAGDPIEVHYIPGR